MTASTPSLDTPKSPPKLLTLGGIVLALSTPLITGFLNGYFKVWFDNNGRVLAGLASFWLLTAVVVLLTRYEPGAADHSLWHNIGFRRVKLRTTLIVLILAFVTLFFATLAFFVLARTIFPTDVTTSRVLTLPWPLIILAYLTGTITEEILYRGYALERLQRMTGNWWISGAITGALFVGFHIPAYPMAHIVGFIVPATVVITLVYIWKRNTTYTVLFHGVLNLPILLAGIIFALMPAG